MRRRVWFKVLSNLERDLVDLVIEFVDRPRSTKLIEVLAIVKVKRAMMSPVKRLMEHVGWPGDVKRIALSIDKIKALGWRPRMRSREALREAAKSILSEIPKSLNHSVWRLIETICL